MWFHCLTLTQFLNETLYKMRLYIIAGERSGDMHGGNLVKALKGINADIQIRGWGGDDMQQAGMELVTHYREMAFMGFWEVFKNLGTIKKKLTFCKKDILAFKPDLVVMIDYAGFNLKMAKFCREQGIATSYYISPKLWAWNTKRVNKVKASVDNMYVILPFEVDFYNEFGVEAIYVGNPLVKSISNHDFDQGFIEFHQNKNAIAVLPGSRHQEVIAALDVTKEIALKNPDKQFYVAAVDNLDDETYDPLSNMLNVQIFYNKTYEILKASRAAIVTSGTATLETAIIGTPQVVVYGMSKVTYEIARRVLKVPYISLVNLIADREVIPELIQHDFNAVKVQACIDKLMNGTERERQLAGYTEVQKKLGTKDSSLEVAQAINTMLGKS